MNFDFLNNFPELSSLYNFCSDGEEFVYSKPSISGGACRKALEYTVKLVYNVGLKTIPIPSTLYEMVSTDEFMDFFNSNSFMNAIHYARKLGNKAVHDSNFTKDDALLLLQYIHTIVVFVLKKLNKIDDAPDFVTPDPNKAPTKVVIEPEEPDEEEIELDDDIASYFPDSFRDIEFKFGDKEDEEYNRGLFLKAFIEQAEWKIAGVDNQVMSSTCCLNMLLDDGDKIDYVFYGSNGKPLAIIEYAKDGDLIQARTDGLKHSRDLEKKYGYKPIIYYTNGYLIYMIEPAFYDQPRKVSALHTIKELELLTQRNSERKDISKVEIDDKITNRTYQKEAIQAVCDAFTTRRRKSLIVMATGTGKTRVSISLVDVLSKNMWVRNILFLADRTSLVLQAKKNFAKLLPNITTAVFTGDSDEKDYNARIIFSTYQSMIRMIDGPKKQFGIGRFDLIIVDEAHRSIFNKYGLIFDYFDALMIGLTATPRSEIDKSSYETFGLNNGEPDYCYDLQDAIKDGYLVNYTVQDKTTKLLKRGTTYDKLTPEEKKQFDDETFNIEEEEKVPTLEASDFIHSVINEKTIDLMINDLMENGQKIEGGEKLGKTIIFAPNHNFALEIVNRFKINYPNLDEDFCVLIDNTVDDNQNLIDNFEIRDHNPQIAVSVDMLDTGIDVPDILNLVFFKNVYSKIKFLQMLGRGTRLSKDIFGPGMDKEYFTIFDYFDNFNYFSDPIVTQPNSTNNGKSQSVIINECKLDILNQLCSIKSPNNFEKQYRDDLLNEFKNKINYINNDSLQAKKEISYVNKYRKPAFWNPYTPDEDETCLLKKHIIPILNNQPSSFKERIFDIIMFKLELEVENYKQDPIGLSAMGHRYNACCNSVDKFMKKLLKFKTIPEIVNKSQLIKSMIKLECIIKDFSYENIENVRKSLRELMNYIDFESVYYHVNFFDEILDTESEEPKKTYNEKAFEYLNDPKNKIVEKIRNLDPLTQDEKNELKYHFENVIGTPAEFATWCGKKEFLVKIRSLVGIDDKAISDKFGNLFDGSIFDEEQTELASQIVEFARLNGDFPLDTIQNESPFNDIDFTALLGNKIIYISNLINSINKAIL